MNDRSVSKILFKLAFNFLLKKNEYVNYIIDYMKV